MIQLSNVSKVYGRKDQTFRALDDVSLSIPDGASVAIVGKSGSGKSTLMHVMSGLDRASSGTITVDGTDISQMKPKQIDSFRARKIGFIFQSFFVQGNDSCYNNVSLPLEISRVTGRVRRQRIQEALKEVELTEKTQAKARTLSGGQKQRLAIARAISSQPRILFADEPTGNLDSITGKKIEDLLFGLNKKSGVTLVIVTHDDELASKCDMQFYLRDGRLVNEVRSNAVKLTETEIASQVKMPTEEGAQR